MFLNQKHITTNCTNPQNQKTTNYYMYMCKKQIDTVSKVPKAPRQLRIEILQIKIIKIYLQIHYILTQQKQDVNKFSTINNSMQFLLMNLLIHIYGFTKFNNKHQHLQTSVPEMTTVGGQAKRNSTICTTIDYMKFTNNHNKNKQL